MNADDGMDVGGWFTSYVAACQTGIRSLLEAWVDCFKAFQERFELWTEALICFHLRKKEGVATGISAI